jgi:hypothetical protein
MKKPRERFRHLRPPRSANESDAQSESRANEAKIAIAELVDNVVDVPTYRARTEHADPSPIGRVLLRWVFPILLGIGVLFGVVYGAVSLHDRNQRIQSLRDTQNQRARALMNLRAELESDVELLRNQVVVLDALEQSARSWQHLPPPKMDVTYASSMWDAFAVDAVRAEDPVFFGNVERFYDAFPNLERAFRDLERDANNWHAWTKGITTQSLTKLRDKTLINRVRRVDNEFADKVARLRDALVLQRDSGERLLEQFPPIPYERKAE